MKAVDGNRYKCQPENNPSFSSTLLDIIYRSIDEKDNEEEEEEGVIYRNESNQFKFNSNVDSTYRSRLQSTRECMPKPRPIRVRNDEHNECKHQLDDLQPDSTKKSRDMMKKIYRYLNKGKQPISPGARLSTFLISLFATTNSKKKKKKSKISISSPCNGGHEDAIIHPNIKSKSKSKTAPNCSTSSRSSRSVRFYPESMFIDKSIHKNEDTGRNLMRKYEKKVEIVFDSIENNVTNDHDGDDDDVSCASSDLFELDHICAMQELPLYETTSIDTNRAIANGLIL